MYDLHFFTSEPNRMTGVLRQAVALGAPLVAAPLARETECSWSEQLRRLGAATSLAKEHNVTLALQNAAHTFAAGTHDCKRVAKEADSAWLRYAPSPQELDAASDPSLLAPNAVLLWSELGSLTPRSIARTFSAFPAFRGHVALDHASGGATPEGLRAGVRLWREALCRQIEELNHK
jgi:hypothetical protein